MSPRTRLPNVPYARPNIDSEMFVFVLKMFGKNCCGVLKTRDKDPYHQVAEINSVCTIKNLFKIKRCTETNQNKSDTKNRKAHTHLFAVVVCSSSEQDLLSQSSEASSDRLLF